MPPYIGRALPRLEDERLITGRGRFVADIKLEGLLHAAFHRSTIGHGRILSVEVEAARSMPGVVAVLTADDLPASAATMTDWLPRDMAPHARPTLAGGEVKFVGEAIAMVVAEHPYQAQDAAEAIVAEIEPLPAVTGGDAALAAGAPLVHDGTESNLARHAVIEYGDSDAAFGGDAVVAHARLFASRICGAAMETRGVTAAYDPPTDSVTMWSSTQGVFAVRAQVASLLGIDEERVTVLAEDVGGGFGPKGSVYPEEVMSALAALRLRRAVRWTATRSEDTATTVHAHGTVLDLELAAGPDGKLRGLRGRLLHDIGAYPGAGAGQPDIIVPHLMSAYVLPALHMDIDIVYTNAAPTGFVRGGGRPLGNFGIERMIDRLARKLDVDPAELRRRNLIQPEQMPYDTGYPVGRATAIYDGGDPPRLLKMAMDAIGYTESRSRERDERGRLLGVGVACCVETSGFGRGEPARVRLEKDGTAHLYVGSTPQGQGHQTMAAQVLADRLGWPIGKIKVLAGDTRGVPFALLTAGSRSAMHVGNATALAGAAARRKLLEQAAEVLEADPADLVLDNGTVSVRGAPARAVPVTEVIPAHGIEVSEAFEGQGTAYCSGCHAALVAVDPDTGSVDLLKYVIVHDTGKPINPNLVQGQMHGGFAHGLGFALFEEAIYQPDGGFVSSSFLDYTIVSAAEVSVPLTIRSIVTPTQANPEGFKGAGESGTIPVPATIANAIEDAVLKLNPRAVVDMLPITPNRLFELIHSKTST